MKIKAIIFDFDGVIHNTFNFHREKVGEFTGVQLSESEFRDIHNGNFFKNKNNHLKDIDWQSYRDFIYESQTTLIVESETKDILLALNKTYDLFIITSGGKKNILDYLKNNYIAEVFKEVFGLEAQTSKIDKFNLLFQKYSLTPNNCIFITDTLGDILEANKIKIKTIAVDFGYHSRETLERGKPFKIISSLREILEIVKPKSRGSSKKL
jgi:phosphoglycolate phosphatase